MKCWCGSYEICTSATACGPERKAYVEFPGGAREPDGYIVPCEVTGQESGGWVQVILRPLPPKHRFSWMQWVRKAQLLDESDVMET
jgi:hypothetical protein